MTPSTVSVMVRSDDQDAEAGVIPRADGETIGLSFYEIVHRLCYGRQWDVIGIHWRIELPVKRETAIPAAIANFVFRDRRGAVAGLVPGQLDFSVGCLFGLGPPGTSGRSRLRLCLACR